MPTPTPDELAAAFGSPAVRFDAGRGGLTRVTLGGPGHGDGSTAEVYLHGGHVTSYRPAGGDDALFISRRAVFEVGKAIRGGVPVCFPWFGDATPQLIADANGAKLSSHGFARFMPWTVATAGSDDGGGATVTLRLLSGESTKALWPHEFRAEVRVSLRPGRLGVTLDVDNRGGQPFTFTAALHTYLAVADVRRVAVGGLGGLDYLDKTAGMSRKRESADPLSLAAETDRVYLDHAGDVVVRDGGRTVTVGKSGSRSTVLWNPWAERAAKIADFGDDEWPAMLCVETANVGDAAVTLGPGESHAMSTTFSVT